MPSEDVGSGQSWRIRRGSASASGGRGSPALSSGCRGPPDSALARGSPEGDTSWHRSPGHQASGQCQPARLTDSGAMAMAGWASRRRLGGGEPFPPGLLGPAAAPATPSRPTQWAPWRRGAPDPGGPAGRRRCPTSSGWRGATRPGLSRAGGAVGEHSAGGSGAQRAPRRREAGLGDPLRGISGPFGGCLCRAPRLPGPSSCPASVTGLQIPCGAASFPSGMDGRGV